MPPNDSANAASSDVELPKPVPIQQWALGVALLGALGYLAYLAFRAYLTPDMLIGLANTLLICH